MSEMREVFLVTFEPTPESGESIGGMDWRTTRESTDALYAQHISDFGDTNTVALWNAYVPAMWPDEQVTEYLDETFVGDTPPGYPIQVHNEPFLEWPHGV